MRKPIIFSIFFVAIIFMNSFNCYSQKCNLNEELKLNTDRKLYCAGETIYFNSDYFINNEKAIPLLSNIIYIELINCTDKGSIIRKKYKISDFKISGKIIIPKDISTGNYILHAFTQYQRNLSSYSHCYQIIKIINPEEKESVELNQIQNDSTIYIIPEGGKLISNLKNRIIIKIPDYLLSDTNKYVITNNIDSILFELKPKNNGICEAELILYAKYKYYLKIKDNLGTVLIKQFPEIKNSGIQTNIKRLKDSVLYTIIQKTSKQQTSVDYVVQIYSSKLNVLFSKDIKLIQPEFKINIPNPVFSEGINYIILSSKENKVIRVNSVFNNTTENIEIKTNHIKYNPRDLIETTLSIEDTNKIIYASISVHQEEKGAEAKYNTHIPIEYFKNPIYVEYLIRNYQYNDVVLVDQLMILHDSFLDINYILKEIKNQRESNVEYIPECRDLSISGFLRNKQTKEPIENSTVFLSVISDPSQFHISTTDKDGGYIFSLNSLYGESDLVFCTEPKDSIAEILINDPFFTDIPDFSELPFVISEYEFELINDLYNNYKIQQKFSRSSDIDSCNSKSPSYFNINDNKISLYPKDYISFENTREMMSEIVPNIRIKKMNKKNFIQRLDDNQNVLPDSPFILLDHIPVFDVDDVLNISPSKIERIEFINKPYLLGENILNGVLMITTINNDFSEIKLIPSATFVTIQGLEKNYSNTFISSSNYSEERIPDFRSTLYWNPNVVLTNDKTKISFNASDRKGNYVYEVKGYDSRGNKYYGMYKIIIE